MLDGSTGRHRRLVRTYAGALQRARTSSRAATTRSLTAWLSRVRERLRAARRPDGAGGRRRRRHRLSCAPASPRAIGAAARDRFDLDLAVPAAGGRRCPPRLVQPLLQWSWLTTLPLGPRRVVAARVARRGERLTARGRRGHHRRLAATRRRGEVLDDVRCCARVKRVGRPRRRGRRRQPRQPVPDDDSEPRQPTRESLWSSVRVAREDRPPWYRCCRGLPHRPAAWAVSSDLPQRRAWAPLVRRWRRRAHARGTAYQAASSYPTSPPTRRRDMRRSLAGRRGRGAQARGRPSIGAGDRPLTCPRTRPRGAAEATARPRRSWPRWW